MRWLRIVGLCVVLAVLGMDSLNGQTAVEDRVSAGREAAARGDHETAFHQYRLAFDAQRDDRVVLAAMSQAAIQLGDLSLFASSLDSLVSTGRAGPNALQHWGAASLQSGRRPDDVWTPLDSYLSVHPEDIEALVAFAEVFEGHALFEYGERLLRGAVDRGVSPAEFGATLGVFREARNDPLGALEAYITVLPSGSARAADASLRIRALLDAWPAEPAVLEAADRLDAARTSAEPSGRRLIAPLRARAYAHAGRWGDAIEAAQDTAMRPSAHGSVLRSVSRIAQSRGDMVAAEEVLETLLVLGPPVSVPEDEALLEDVRRAMGVDEPLATEAFEAVTRASDPASLAAAIVQAESSGIEVTSLAVPRGDLWLSRGRPDSAMAAYAEGVGPDATGVKGLEALARVRLVRSLARSSDADEIGSRLGEILISASSDPEVAAGRIEEVVSRLEADSMTTAWAIAVGLAAEWRGEAGDPDGASEALERAVLRAPSIGEAPALLLASGRWASVAGEVDRAKLLWRRVVEDHARTPYALEARRLLALPSDGITVEDQ
jgi:tetratricopeptide (TPR) repeat protein